MLIKPKFASLTAGLLARKGEAHPAATSELTDELTRSAYLHTSAPNEREVEEPRLPTANEQQALLAKAFEAPEPAPRDWQRAPRSPFASDALRAPPVFDCGQDSAQRCASCPTDPLDERRFHVSVRLKRGRYLRLKLAAASLHKPSQDIIGEGTRRLLLKARFRRTWRLPLSASLISSSE
jgi:hypothetical protein